VKGALAERRAVKARIEEAGEVLILPEDFNDRRKAADASLQMPLQPRQRPKQN